MLRYSREWKQLKKKLLRSKPDILECLYLSHLCMVVVSIPILVVVVGLDLAGPGLQSLMKAYGSTGVAAGLAVVPVAAQVDLES